MSSTASAGTSRTVAPHVGAWIEILFLGIEMKSDSVAPHVGAWIEMGCAVFFVTLSLSHPTWVRGLKFYRFSERVKSFTSHPTWVRGLKCLKTCTQHLCKSSHPTWVRGLKYKYLHPPSHGLRKQPCRERLYGLHQEL